MLQQQEYCRKLAVKLQPVQADRVVNCFNDIDVRFKLKKFEDLSLINELRASIMIGITNDYSFQHLPGLYNQHTFKAFQQISGLS